MTDFFLEKGCALLVEDASLRYYFSSVSLAEGLLIKTSKDSIYFTDARYYYAFKEELKNTSITAKLYTSLDDVKLILKDLGVNKLYIDYDTVTLTRFNEYKSLEVQLEDASLALKKLRSIKSQIEQENIKIASQMALDCFNYILPYLKKGVTEIAIRNRMARFMKKHGTTEAFETIVAFGANSAVPHHVTGKTKLKENQAVLFDFGCLHNGYCSDITRTVFYGTPNEKFISAYELVKNAHIIAKENITNFTTCAVADRFARDYFAKHSKAEYFKHSLGHGVGLEIHEYPTLSKRSDASLKNDMVFTIEPGLYFDGEFGIRIEDTVVLKEGKVVSLMPSNKDLIIIKN